MCEHARLVDVFDWIEAGGMYGSCDVCGSTVRTERPDGRKREVVSYRSEDDRYIHELSTGAR